MELEQFKQAVIVLPAAEADMWRRRYRDRFVDVSLEHYRQYVENYEKFSDGWCYRGYLWDCMMKEAHVVTDRRLKDILRRKGQILTMWDVHSRDHVFIENYWKFPKRAVLSLKAEHLLANLEHLPEDLYVFDHELDWTCVFTHEDNREGRPLRLLVESPPAIGRKIS
jgi:hypothetical protein